LTSPINSFALDKVRHAVVRIQGPDIPTVM
jgi:hypothetical protein